MSARLPRPPVRVRRLELPGHAAHEREAKRPDVLLHRPLPRGRRLPQPPVADQAGPAHHDQHTEQHPARIPSRAVLARRSISPPSGRSSHHLVTALRARRHRTPGAAGGRPAAGCGPRAAGDSGHRTGAADEGSGGWVGTGRRGWAHLCRGLGVPGRGQAQLWSPGTQNCARPHGPLTRTAPDLATPAGPTAQRADCGDLTPLGGTKCARAQAAAPTMAIMPGTLFCPACSAALPDAATRCAACGTQLPAASSDDTAAFQRFYTTPDTGGGGVVGFLRRLFGRRPTSR